MGVKHLYKVKKLLEKEKILSESKIVKSLNSNRETIQIVLIYLELMGFIKKVKVQNKTNNNYKTKYQLNEKWFQNT